MPARWDLITLGKKWVALGVCTFPIYLFILQFLFILQPRSSTRFTNGALRRIMPPRGPGRNSSCRKGLGSQLLDPPRRC